MDGYIKHSATWASVKWPQRRPCKGFKISNFMAAYGRGRLLLTRDTTYRTGGWAAQCVWSLVCAVTRRTRFMLHHWNEQTWPLAYHRQLQSEIIGRGCSAVKLGHWCQCRRQCTHEQVPSEDRQRRHTLVIVTLKDGAGDRPPRTRDFKGSCRCLSQSAQLAVAVQGRAITCFASFTACNETYCGQMSFFSRYLTSRNLILEREQKIQD